MTSKHELLIQQKHSLIYTLYNLCIRCFKLRQVFQSAAICHERHSCDGKKVREIFKFKVGRQFKNMLSLQSFLIICFCKHLRRASFSSSVKINLSSVMSWNYCKTCLLFSFCSLHMPRGIKYDVKR